jgi:cation diffusion facilitator CzcD-associated flavoprotein CzcO
MLDVIIIGAGPYGISIAAHAAEKKLSYKLIGYPMDFWKSQMPQKMFIRTPHELVRLSDPNDYFTIQRYAKETGANLETPLPRPIFVDYAFWFAEKTGVAFTPELAAGLTFDGQTFEVVTDQGSHFQAKNVVISIGVQPFKHVPAAFRELPEHLVSHTSGYTSFDQFSGKDVIVVGSGQSAWEAAALLYETKANVELIYRSDSVKYVAPSKTQEWTLRGIGDIFYRLPTLLKKKLRDLGSQTVPVAEFLRSYVQGKVPEIGGVQIKEVSSDYIGKIRLQLSNGSEKTADHVILATGYRLNVDNVPFLDNSLRQLISKEGNSNEYPKLNINFESNVRGLYFAGPLTAQSHGPTFRFILGLKKTAKTIVSSIARL